MKSDYFLHTLGVCTHTHIHRHTSQPDGPRWEHYNSHRLEYICHLARCSQMQAYHHGKSLGSGAIEWHFTFKSKAVTPSLCGMIVFWTGASIVGGTCGYNNIIWIRMALIANNGQRNTRNKELLLIQCLKTKLGMTQRSAKTVKGFPFHVCEYEHFNLRT